MIYLAWGFWTLNALGSFCMMYRCSRRVNMEGVWEFGVPSGWVWIWQALGVGLVPLLGWSPWHLAWWFPAGAIVCASLARAFVLADVSLFSDSAPERHGSTEDTDFSQAYRSRLALNAMVMLLFLLTLALAILGVVDLIRRDFLRSMGGFILAGVAFSVWGVVHNWALTHPGTDSESRG
ncbi:MAG: hypothetical protein IMF16_00190 [Proteobacteria bacterium]|nr:hypothetical protein [Pseudomonadota bacterium]